jgi:hypothetical protein
VSTTISSSVEIPLTEPRELIAGVTWLWKKILADFPSSAWTLAYNLRGVGKLDITALADPDGVTFDVVEDAAASAALSSGLYRWVATVTNNASPTPTGEVYPVGQGDFDILVNYAAALEGALQPQEEIELAAVNAEILARFGQVASSNGGPASVATSPGSAHNEIEIAQRKLVKVPLEGKGSLYAIQSKLLNKVARLKYGGTLPPSVIVFGDNRRLGWWE